MNLQNGNVLIIDIQNEQVIMIVHLRRSTWPGDDVKTVCRENSTHYCSHNQRDGILQEVNASLDRLARLRNGPLGNLSSVLMILAGQQDKKLIIIISD